MRRDLRLADNPALSAAAATGRPILCVFVLDEAAVGRWALGGASRWWLHHSLAALAHDLAQRGGALVLRRGWAADVLTTLTQETGAASVFWNRLYEPANAAQEATIARRLGQLKVEAQSFKAGLLFEMGEVLTASGEPYRVFTPFWRACLAKLDLGAPLPAPKLPPPSAPLPASDRLEDWGLLPRKPDWAAGLREVWRPGEAGAQAQLAAFLESGFARYAAERDRPAQDAVSRLSPHLHWGEVSPRQVAAAVEAAGDAQRAEAARDKYLSELGWREFSAQLLHHAPSLPERSLQSRFHAFPWRNDPEGLRAWRRGRTGYPLVDAGMRQLWETGWMHNRVRMVAASFLVKHLLIDWRLGQDWFWDTLVDADLANNAASWQWVAGSGADAAPYFRIFNPVAQGERFDPDGAYVRRWLPELAALPAEVIHRPWTAAPLELAGAGVRLGATYPHPIVDHASARARALSAYAGLKAAA